eukprot:EG_transcript_604
MVMYNDGDQVAEIWSPFTIPQGAAEVCIEEDQDPTAKLLAGGLEPLLKTIVDSTGDNRHPGIFVSFQDLHFFARTFRGSSMIATLGNRLAHLLTFWQYFETEERDVLKNVTGSFRAGRTTLLLGPPQSGKSSLMKAIAGRLEEGRHGRLQGSILYAGRDLRHETKSPDRIFLPKLVGYVPQTGSHMAPLTVRETVQFALDCTSRCEEQYLLQEEIPREQLDRLMYIDSLYSDIIMDLYGIRRIANSPVAAISTGQLKRLTLAEITVMRTPVLLADEISTGLDSATTFDICQAICTAAHTRHRTTVISLVHLTQEAYELFDEVTVMCAGQIAFQGPIEEAVPYFEALGFQCPPTKSHAEFLMEVTLPDGMERLRCPTSSEVLVGCVEDFGPRWLQSAHFQRRMQEDAVLQEKSQKEFEALPHKGYYHHKLTSRYTTSLLHSTWLCVKRHATLMNRAKKMIRIRMAVVAFTATFMGTLYLQLSFSAYTLRCAVLFYTMLNMMMGYNALPILFNQRQVIAAQTEADFYPPISQIAAIHIIDIPLCLVETIIFVTLVYWLVGLAAEAERYVLFIIICYFLRMGMFAFFRALGMLCPNDFLAMGLGTFWVVVFVQYHGYLVQEPNLVYWWIWAYWINPVQYAMTALMLQEFHSPKFQQLRNASLPQEGTLGDYYLHNRGTTTNDLRFGTAFAYLVGWWLLMIVIQGIIMKFVRWPAHFPPKPPPRQPTPADPPQAPPIQFPLCTLAWTDINYDAPGPRKGLRRVPGRRVLHDLSGFAAPGTITGLMGASGSGKTTFLNVLAGRKTTGTVHGTILLNGQPLPPALFHRFAAIVDQAPLLPPVSTLGEALRFAAALRLPRGLPATDRESHVQEVLTTLDLQLLTHCPIGTCLTAEQVKRLSIGLELVANPAVLFLDEPTCGLDPIATQRVLQALQVVQRSGRTVFCTLHQPSPEAFDLLDRVMVLQTGRCVFFGEPKQVPLYFGAIPGVLPYEPQKNAATWMMTAIKSAGYNLAELYASSTVAEANLKLVLAESEPVGEPLVVAHHYQASQWVQFRMLLVRWLLLQWRSPEYNVARLISVMLIAFAQGSMFWQLKITTIATMMSALGAQFVLFVFVGYLFCIAPQSLLARERVIFYRERANRMYSVFAFNAAVSLAEFPFVFLNTVVGAIILYWMMGLLPNAGAFFFWFFVLFLCLLLCTLYGYLVAWTMPAPDMSIAVVGISIVAFELVTGLSLPRLSIGWWWRWLHYIVPLPYIFQAAISSQLYCEPTETESCPMMNAGPYGEVQMETVWDYTENRFNFDYGDRWMYVGIIISTIAIIHIVSVLSLQFMNHEKR